MRLDRDWYTGAEEGGVAGDEEHNPLSQYEDLRAIKEAEIAIKQVVSCIKSIFQLDLYLSLEKGFRSTSPTCKTFHSFFYHLSKPSLRMPTTTYGKPTEWSLQV